MPDFSQMTPEQKRAWALSQSIAKAPLEEDPEVTTRRAEAFHAYVFQSDQESVSQKMLKEYSTRPLHSSGSPIVRSSDC